MKTILEKKSYGKINLYLEVHNRLESGFHNISTLFSEIGLYDILKFSVTKNGDLKLLSTIENLANQENLIYKVAIFIQNRYSVRCGALIELEKNIPIAAGLGGGSSNAATTIKGLSELWSLELKREEMHEIAAHFGSDINFFLDGFQAIGKNRGEIIEPLGEEVFFDNILLLNPGFEISSREAYDKLQITNHKSQITPTSTLKSQSEIGTRKSGVAEQFPIPYPLEKLLETKNPEYCFNRLEEGICQKYPIIRETLELLEKHGAIKAILSGSGPTMIGFFDNPQTMKKTQKFFLEKKFWSYMTTTRRR